MTEQVLTTYYITDGSLKFGRYDDYDLKQQIKQKWKVINDTNHGLCGNLHIIFRDNIATLTDEHDFKNIQSYKQISSSLALYRTVSLFECGLNSENVDFYKMNWQIILEHKETKITLALGEWKGGFKIFTPFNNIKNIDEKYKLDVEELLNLLASPNMTIGYDGTIAGTIA